VVAIRALVDVPHELPPAEDLAHEALSAFQRDAALLEGRHDVVDEAVRQQQGKVHERRGGRVEELGFGEDHGVLPRAEVREQPLQREAPQRFGVLPRDGEIEAGGGPEVLGMALFDEGHHLPRDRIRDEARPLRDRNLAAIGLAVGEVEAEAASDGLGLLLRASVRR
jgi:hypothetical protein